jgi:hypothetical protein
MTSPETLNTKVAINELSFPLVTHTVYSDARFGSYGILKSLQSAGSFLDRQDRLANDQVLSVKDAWNMVRVIYEFHRPLTQLFNAYSRTPFWYTKQRLQPFEYNHMRSLADCRKMDFGFGLDFGQRRDYNF